MCALVVQKLDTLVQLNLRSIVVLLLSSHWPQLGRDEWATR